MASTAVTAEQPTNTEVFSWLKTLPLAPEYHPTLAEFQDPIGYIFKIEKEASKYGICKIVPPVAPPGRKAAIANLNRSLAARSSSPNPKSPPTFTTRQQQIGFCPRKHRPVQKPVWKSGEHYTLPQFEAKAKCFERNFSRKSSKKALSALEIETLYWKATVDKPFSVEYANDMPGSAFMPVSARKSRETGEAVTVGETAWNMRGVSRAKGSLLRFMKEEIPGVTSPMVYIAMMFSWFAWHVEDHDLHSLNYLHMGAGKTWYGVPRDAAVAFEEVIRVHGYGGEINPLVTFAILGEKNTVMSPEVLISAGVPCCRLVQNAGEFVVTFPRAYHSGFSHGFNCGEAANIATPEWLRVAKDAAIRRASINCPPMVSHFQLLYDLALSLCSRSPSRISIEPRSSRLKDKKKGEGEALIKELFVQDVIQNNDLLNTLSKGSSIVILPQNSSDDSGRSNLNVSSQFRTKPRLPLSFCSAVEEMKASKGVVSDNIILHRKYGLHPVGGKFSSACDGNMISSNWNPNIEGERTFQGDKLRDQGLFSCVTCGILSFACAAIVEPSEEAARYLMSADCSIFSDRNVDSGGTRDAFTAISETLNGSELNICSGWKARSTPDGLFDVPIQSADKIQTLDQTTEVVSDSDMEDDTSALGLLALAYANSSDTEDDQVETDISVFASETRSRDCSRERLLDCNSIGSPSLRHGCEDEVPINTIDYYTEHGRPRSSFRNRNDQTYDCKVEFETDNISSMESNSLGGRFCYQMRLSPAASNFTPFAQKAVENTTMSFAPRCDEDSSRMHVFCLQHAIEVEQQLRSIGGAHIFLLCHPDYPELEAEAKLVAEELGIENYWNDISLREATKEDEETIRSAVESDEAIHGNGDWAVKLGINLYYSANLSRSPLYSKQMPYNSVIYDAFGRNSPDNSQTKPKVYGRRSAKQKKIVVAGKWCGKVWMSNQVHPLLAEKVTEEEQEHERDFSATRVKPDVKPERFLEKTHISETVSASSRNSKKRKNRVESESNVKPKFPKVEISVEASYDSPEENSLQQYRRNFRNKQMKQETSRPRNTCDIEDELEGGPSTRLRKRASKPPKVVENKPIVRKQRSNKKALAMKSPTGNSTKVRDEEEQEHPCDIDGCTMSFGSKHELVLHKRNVCPVKGCGKKFFSHKYLVQHRRVHMDDRPLKCPWKGCKMTFKWAWARTEHIRVHTGARPYVCTESGCGQTFRFVSDFSRHKRKTGHLTAKSRG